MRSCTGATSLFGVVVMIVQLSTHLVTLPIEPARPQAGEGEGLIVIAAEADRLLPSVGAEPPLVEAVGGDQAAATAEQTAV
jgi:hypothetical protein